MSKIEVNQISSQCGSTLTIGQSGDTVTLASGATQTGFGRTGTVDWCTTAKTAPFTGVSGKGYFVNTTCGAVTVTLPATPTAGDIISIKDYAGTFQTNNLTICRNGSLINAGSCNAILDTQAQSVTLIYVDGTKGWQDVQDSTSNVTGFKGIIATGGTITTCGNYKIHTFTSSGCFTVSTLSPAPANNYVDYVVVAGGGGGGCNGGGGGGAGGFRESHTVPISGCYTASPLASGTSLPVTASTYPITIGAGGDGANYPGGSGTRSSNGSSSIFSTITSAGGGYGGLGPCTSYYNGNPGGSGGGGVQGPPTRVSGTGNTPPVTPPQGNDGGTKNGAYNNGAGGGGATSVGGCTATPNLGGSGGTGATTGISGSSSSYAGGGGGGGYTAGGGAAGLGGGGSGSGEPAATYPLTAGTANTGGGGGGGNASVTTTGAAGGSGIVIIRYRYQ